MEKLENYYKNTRNDMLNLLPEYHSSVLEVGCGEGSFKNCLKNVEEYWGIEPYKEAADIAQKKLDVVFNNTYEEVADKIPDNKFDLIVCNDVIEHMIDHNAFLSSIKEKLTDNGALILSVPNVRYVRNLKSLLFNKDWKYKNEGVLDKTHLRFFTEKSLKRTINENGFKMDALQLLNPYKAKGFKKVFYYIAQLILGHDINYIQIAARIRK